MAARRSLIGSTDLPAIYFGHEGPTNDIPSTCKIDKSAVLLSRTGPIGAVRTGLRAQRGRSSLAAARQVVPLPVEWTPVGGRLVHEEKMVGVLAKAHILRKRKGIILSTNLYKYYIKKTII